jgi:enoyl-CoA hydratase
MADYVRFEEKNHIAYITINRPERMNALGQDVRNGLIDAFLKVRHEPSIRVAVITGAGDKAFSAGADLKEHTELNAKKPYRVGPDYGALDEPPHSSAIVIETYKPVHCRGQRLCAGRRVRAGPGLRHPHRFRERHFRTS